MPDDRAAERAAQRADWPVHVARRGEESPDGLDTTPEEHLLVRPTVENAARVFEALIRFGAPVTAAGLTVADFTKKDLVHQIGRPPRRIDLLTDISGVDFEVAWRHRIETDWRGLRIGMIGLDDLLANKLASGRPKDLADARELERLRDHRRKPGGAR